MTGNIFTSLWIHWFDTELGQLVNDNVIFRILILLLILAAEFLIGRTMFTVYNLFTDKVTRISSTVLFLATSIGFSIVFWYYL